MQLDPHTVWLKQEFGRQSIPLANGFNNTQDLVVTQGHVEVVKTSINLCLLNLIL